MGSLGAYDQYRRPARQRAVLSWLSPPLGYVRPLERPLPSNLDAERSVLGAILLDNHALNAAIEKLKPEDFFLDQHRRIFQQMIELGKTQQGIDLVTLCDLLQRKGELEASGGAAYVSQLMDGVPRVSHLEHYARIVKEKSQLRHLIHATHAIQQNALEAEEDSAAILSRATEIFGLLRANQDAPGESGLVSYSAAELAGPLVPSPPSTSHIPSPQSGIIAVVDGAPKSAGKTTMLCTAAAEFAQGRVVSQPRDAARSHSAHHRRELSDDAAGMASNVLAWPARATSTLSR